MDVAIVGGGIAGLVLALALHQRSTTCTIYELRQTADIANPGAIGLPPNALRLLDRLGFLHQLQEVGWPLTSWQFRDESDSLISSVAIGDEARYGYNALRIVRRRLHDILLRTIAAAGIPMISGKKFSHVISASARAVTFAFDDGTEVTSSILIGADGIHSTIRKEIASSIQPEYKGSLTMAAKIDRNPLLDLPRTPSLDARLHSISVTRGRAGSFLAIAQSADGQEMSLALDRPYPDQSREQWDALLGDRERQYDMFMEGYESWSETIKMLMRAVRPEHMYRSWPFYALPDLEEWSTPDRRVILIGDAAHAVPPSAGQGAAMAIEDAWSLGHVLGRCHSDNVGVDSQAYQEKVVEWQRERRDRLDKVRNLTKRMGNARLPEEMRSKLDKDEYFDANANPRIDNDVDWLYAYDYKD